MRNSFTFYKSFYDAINTLGDKAQLKLYKSIMKMFFNRCENVTELEQLCDEIETELEQNRKVFAQFLLMKPHILKSAKSSLNGVKGGAPEGNNNAKKTSEKQANIKDKNIKIKDKSINVEVVEEEDKEAKQATSTPPDNFSDLSDWHGFYKNVHLTSNQYGRLLSEIANKQALDGIIEELSSNIAQKKEKSPPYDENFPDMHFATLKAYWRFRKLNGFSRPPTNTDKAKALKDELDKLAQEYRIKDLNSG